MESKKFKQLKPCDPMAYDDHPDHAGGYMDNGPTGRSVPKPGPGNHKASMIDGPYGGKKPVS